MRNHHFDQSKKTVRYAHEFNDNLFQRLLEILLIVCWFVFNTWLLMSCHAAGTTKWRIIDTNQTFSLSLSLGHSSLAAD